MGMFDYVSCKYPLTDPTDNGRSWQTKSLNGTMDNYEITEDGQLKHLNYDARVEDDEESPFGTLIYRDNERWVDWPHNGELEIHDFDRVEMRFISYLIWLKDGKVNHVQFGNADYRVKNDK